MNIDKELKDRIAQLSDINSRLKEIEKKIGAAQEEGRALHGKGLELKGAVEMLLQLQAKEAEDLKRSETAKLILPEGVKPIIPEMPVEEAPTEIAGPVLETAEGVITPELEVK